MVVVARSRSRFREGRKPFTKKTHPLSLSPLSLTQTKHRDTKSRLIKYWKGDHIISVTPRVIEEHLRLAAAADQGGSGGASGGAGGAGGGSGSGGGGSGGWKALGVDASRLHWTPFVAPGNKK